MLVSELHTESKRLTASKKSLERFNFAADNKI